jgi:hypothetical protein
MGLFDCVAYVYLVATSRDDLGEITTLDEPYDPHCALVGWNGWEIAPAGFDDVIRRGFDPITPHEGCTRPWPSTCRVCKKPVSPTLADALDGHGCLMCKDRRVDPAAAKELFFRKGCVPLKPFTGGVKMPWDSLHECGNQVSPTLARVRRATIRTACTACSPGGWSDDAPSLVYVIVHLEWDAGKVGIMNLGSRRLDVFRGHGWQVVGTVAFGAGREARRIEKSALDLVMGTGADRIPPYHSPEELPVPSRMGAR